MNPIIVAREWPRPPAPIRGVTGGATAGSVVADLATRARRPGWV